jgi:signal transduction histidine kinase
VHTIITLKLAERELQGQDDRASELVSEALAQAENATAELRELAHGILPAVLTRGGLRASVAALASRMTVPVEVDVSAVRAPQPIEAIAYFVVAEALTNVAKHARARRATVTARADNSALRVEVRDDGAVGAQPDGSGLIGLRDRLAAHDGTLTIDSPPGGGTVVTATIPLPAPA